MAAEGLNTATLRAEADWHIAQLIPRGWCARINGHPLVP